MESDNTPNKDNSLDTNQKKKDLYINSLISSFSLYK